MTTKVIEVWRVEKWDGADRMSFHAYVSKVNFPTLVDAKNAFPEPHFGVNSELLLIHDTKEDIVTHSRTELRRSAWLKLTPAERKAFNMLEEPK